MTIKINVDVDSEIGLIIAIQSFIYHCSEDVIPKNCDREQLVQNIQSFQDLKHRKLWIEKGINPNNIGHGD